MPRNRPAFHPILDYPQQLFAIYQQKINQQQQLLKRIKTVLPAELAAHTLYCVMKDTKLLLYTDSAIWSSQLRFYQQAILTEAREQGYQRLETLQIKLMTGHGEKARSAKVRVPSKKNIELIRHLASQQKNDHLQRALAKLSDTLSKLSDKSR